ncbi:hypothetical protein D3C81_1770550 [compost metagenome]
MSAELLSPVHNGDTGSNALQLVRPVYCRITSAGDQHVFAAERLQLLHGIVQISHLVTVRSFDLQLGHLQNAIANRQNDGPG